MTKIFKRRNFILLVSILIIGGLLRFWDLATTPPSLYWDEVSQGFNAYSILTTLHDEHGEFLPIARFQAYGDYKAPVYIYLDVISLALFGKNEFAVRFPSAFFGTLTILIAYFLSKELFFGHKYRNKISLLTALFLSISPWHIQLSRGAYEANIATFFTILGLFLFFLAKRKAGNLFFLSSLSFILAFYAFNAHRVFVPLLVIILLAVYFKDLFTRKKIFVISSGLFSLLLLIPFILFFKNPESRLRFQEVNIFSEAATIEESNKLQLQDGNSIFSNILHNRRVLFALEYIENYFDFFRPDYLFFRGDVNPRFSTQENGQLYLFMLPLLIIGVYYIFKKPDRNTIFILLWFVAAPIAAATARETPHALRSETYIPTYELIASIGGLNIILFLKKFRQNKQLVLYFLAGIVLAYFIIDFVHTYFSVFPGKYSQDWQYGYKETIQEVEKYKNNYDNIIFTNAYGRAYMYVLWYGNYTPEEFWRLGVVKRDAFGFYNTERFGKYIFDEPLTSSVSQNQKVLFVAPSNKLPKSARLLKKIEFKNGMTAFEIGVN